MQAQSKMLLAATFLLAVAVANCGIGSDAEALHVALGSCDITPEITNDRPVWLAGYGWGRRATGVHDPLFARCLVLRHGNHTIALISLDLVGLPYPTVLRIRQQLDQCEYVLVSSTHNHEGPDVIGLWGMSPLVSGLDNTYVDSVVGRVVDLVRKTTGLLRPAIAEYGTASDDSLINDSREPYVKDGVLRAIRFREPGSNKVLGILVQWSCHPEALGDRNTLITADFPAATITSLSERYGCPVVYFAGALGGLMAPPRGRIRDAQGQVLGSGDFEYARLYGVAVADLAAQALERPQSMDLKPFRVSTKPIMVPIENPLYRTARALGVLQRPGRVWTGDFERLGEPSTLSNAHLPSGVETEVAYLRLGRLHVAAIPGEIYPELVYGKIQTPPDPGADFPDAPCEPSVVSLFGDDPWLLLGLANDEIGYLIPKRQWDERPPYAYGRDNYQYGEINSCGAQAAGVVMQALANRVNDIRGK